MQASQLKNFAKFQAEIAYAYDKVDFYHKLLDSHGINPQDIQSPADMAKLPTTEKKHYRVNFPIGVMAKGNKFNDPTLYRTQSSGTSGERLVTLEFGMLLLERAISCASVYPQVMMSYLTPQKRTVRYAAPNCSDVECANPNSAMDDRMLHDGTLVLPVYHDLMTTSETMIERAIAEIIQYQPHLYYVDPSHFAFLLSHCEKRGIQLPQAPVITTYSAMTQIARRQIEAHFKGKPVVELAAMSEMGWLAMSCPHGRLHLNQNAFMMELLIDERPAEIGELAELVLTSLDKGVIPHLRYRTGDSYRLLDGPCPCGHDSQTVIVEGRQSYFLHHHGEAVISPRDIDQAIGNPQWLDMYQLVQDGQEQFNLRLVVNSQYQSGDERQLEDNLTTMLSARFGEHHHQISCELVNYLSSERSGKFQFCKRQE